MLSGFGGRNGCCQDSAFLGALGIRFPNVCCEDSAVETGLAGLERFGCHENSASLFATAKSGAFVGVHQESNETVALGIRR